MAEECDQARLHVPIQAICRVFAEIVIKSKALPVSGVLADPCAGAAPFAPPD